MKAFVTTALLILIIGNIGAVDIQSYQFIDHIRAISVAGKPEIYEDGVIFTAPSSFHRVGISFAYEGYAKVYWFKRLVVPKDSADLIPTSKRQEIINPNTDSGIMFHIQPIPGDIQNMDYRMIIDGLWTTDPQNPLTVTGPSGIVESRVSLPQKSGNQGGAGSGTYRFNYRGPPGETITVAGSFNHWDPFMYEMQEISPGFYSLSLPLPSGNFQYVFFSRGEQLPDPDNPRRLYARDGRIISEAVMP